jgi:hypothetical protein
MADRTNVTKKQIEDAYEEWHDESEGDLADFACVAELLQGMIFISNILYKKKLNILNQPPYIFR